MPLPILEFNEIEKHELFVSLKNANIFATNFLETHPEMQEKHVSAKASMFHRAYWAC